MNVPRMNVPRVSVIVPVYNTAARLGACLEALRAQDLADCEFILVDDGSTDGSLALCRAFAAKDARFRVLSGPNGFCKMHPQSLQDHFLLP